MKKSAGVLMGFVLVASVIFFSLVLHSRDDLHSSPVDPLALFSAITADKAFYSQRTGEPKQLNASEKKCINPLVRDSDAVAYYQLKKNGYKKKYDIYGKESQYARDVKSLVKRMDASMDYFKKSGLMAAISGKGKIPALMFDIDNTVEFSSGIDGDPTGEGPPISGMVDFARRHCFKNELVCYFITARDCNAQNTKSTTIWLKREMKMTDAQIDRYTHLSGGFRTNGCETPKNTSIAYKDVIREALEKEQKIYWLMSIGDQLTDSLGHHSGMKIEVPNQLFHSDVVPNQFAPWGAGNCSRTITVAPDSACSQKLVNVAIKHSSVKYCQNQ